MTKEGFLLRLPIKEMNALKRAAERSGMSANSYCSEILRSALSVDRASGKWSSLIKTVQDSSFARSVVGIILFGSVARGTDTSSSDCDILLVLNSKVKPTREFYRRWDEEVFPVLDRSLFSGKEISVHFASIPNSLEDAHGLWLELAIDGIVIWQVDEQCEMALRRLRLAIAEGLFLRRLVHGHPYWQRKGAEFDISKVK